MTIGEKIKDLRKSAGLSQAELAFRLGLFQKDVSRWESGTHSPQAETLARLCKALNVSADELLLCDGQLSFFDQALKGENE